MGVWRDGEVKSVTVRLSGRDNPDYLSWATALSGDEQPSGDDSLNIPPELQIVDLERWGVGLANLGERYRNRFNVGYGVYVAYVEPSGLFELAGIPRNTLLMEIDGARVETVQQARQILDSATNEEDNYLLKMRRDDGVMLFFELLAHSE